MIDFSDLRPWLIQFYGDVGSDSHTPDEFANASIQMVQRLQHTHLKCKQMPGQAEVNRELEKRWYTMRDLSPGGAWYLHKFRTSI